METCPKCKKNWGRYSTICEYCDYQRSFLVWMYKIHPVGLGIIVTGVVFVVALLTNMILR